MARLLWSPTGEEVTAHSEAEERDYLARGYRETATPAPPAPAPVEAVTAEADDDADYKPKRTAQKKK